MISQAMEVFIAKLGGTYSVLYRQDLNDGERALAFLKQFAEISVSYPGVTKSLVGKMMWEETANPVLVDSQKKGVEAFATVLQQVTGIRDLRALHELSLQMISAMIYLVLIGKQLPNLYGIDYTVRDEREAYVERLYNQYTSEFNKESK